MTTIAELENKIIKLEQRVSDLENPIEEPNLVILSDLARKAETCEEDPCKNCGGCEAWKQEN